MGKDKIAITTDENALAEIDPSVQQGVSTNRSKAVVQNGIARVHPSQMARECAKLDVKEEQALANEGYAAASEWPEY
ncbi:MAG TPA: CopG family transcriptional regulator [Thermoanaerobaculia bacterium]|jgi:hypothetical protein